MADYYPLVAKAIAGLQKNTGEGRRALYERARTALVAQLRGMTNPSLVEAEITRERLALEEAIRRVEAESARRGRDPAAPSKQAAPAGRAPSFAAERRMVTAEGLEGFHAIMAEAEGLREAVAETAKAAHQSLRAVEKKQPSTTPSPNVRSNATGFLDQMRTSLFGPEPARMTPAVSATSASASPVVRAVTRERLQPLGAKASGILISYRRNDSAAITGRLYDKLVSGYGSERVFMDVESIPFGVDFQQHIHELLRRSALALVMIGSEWVGKRMKQRSRIMDAEDPVRIEIEAALKLRIPIIPVLTEGATMPIASTLPEALRPLVRINAAMLQSGKPFHAQADGIVRQIDKMLAEHLERISGQADPDA